MFTPRQSSNATPPKLPIMCKILIFINIAFWCLELAVPTMVNSYCLSPKHVMRFPWKFGSSLFLSNFLHLNPLVSGPMGLFHIVINMMTLSNIGRYLEKEFGSIAFIGITLFFALTVGPMQIPIASVTNGMTEGSIRLLSIYQCGIFYCVLYTINLFVYLIRYWL